MKKAIVAILFFIPLSGYCALNQTYPSAATTQIRIDAYLDAIRTIANSTFTVALSTYPWDTTSERIIQQILDEDIEQYLVLTETSAPAGWHGWCINQRNVPVPCP